MKHIFLTLIFSLTFLGTIYCQVSFKLENYINDRLEYSEIIEHKKDSIIIKSFYNDIKSPLNIIKYVYNQNRKTFELKFNNSTNKFDTLKAFKYVSQLSLNDKTSSNNLVYVLEKNNGFESIQINKNINSNRNFNIEKSNRTNENNILLDNYQMLDTLGNILINENRSFKILEINDIKLYLFYKLETNNQLKCFTNIFTDSLGWNSSIDNCYQKQRFNFIVEKKENRIEILNFNNYKITVKLENNNLIIEETKFPPFPNSTKKIISKLNNYKWTDYPYPIDIDFGGEWCRCGLLKD